MGNFSGDWSDLAAVSELRRKLVTFGMRKKLRPEEAEDFAQFACAYLVGRPTTRLRILFVEYVRKTLGRIPKDSPTKKPRRWSLVSSNTTEFNPVTHGGTAASAEDELIESATLTQMKRDARIMAVMYLDPINRTMARVFMMAIDGMAHSEISRELRLPLGAVSSYVFQAKHILQEEIKGQRPAKGKTRSE